MRPNYGKRDRVKVRSLQMKSTQSQMLTDAFFRKPNYYCIHAVTCVRSIHSHVCLISVNGIQDGGGLGGGRVRHRLRLTYRDN